MNNDQLETTFLDTQANHYDILGVDPASSMIEIKQNYRKLSKLYHPDTTTLPPKIATTKFQKLNSAYAILSQPHLRQIYDYQIGYNRVKVRQSHSETTREIPFDYARSAYLDSQDRPLSSGEIFALFMLTMTIIGCLLLVLLVNFFHQDQTIQL